METNKLPLVSIQCLVYNHEPYLRQCLDGFVMQKTNFKFEAIVHDDVSTDGSAAIIREYAEKYPDIIKPIFEIENQYSKHDGSLDRIMRDACKGKYIALCEGDDYWIDPLKLQKQVDLLENNLDCSLCCGGFIRRHKYQYSVENSKFDTDVPYFRFTLKDWSSYWYTKTLTLIYRRTILEDFQYNKFMWCRDVHTCYHLLRKGDGIYMNDILGVYNIHEGGIFSLTSSDSKLVTHYNVYSEIHYNYKDDVSREILYNCVLNLIINKPSSLGISELCQLFREGMALSNGLKQQVKLIVALIYNPKSVINYIRKRN